MKINNETFKMLGMNSSMDFIQKNIHLNRKGYYLSYNIDSVNSVIVSIKFIAPDGTVDEIDSIYAVSMTEGLKIALPSILAHLYDSITTNQTAVITA